ncbi:MAG: hypothetical protein JWM52_572 [Candidatus Saccharibacteria bacterium]|nr:hypothetical protein [Candidatus Saccharibacteria bacterium]
MLTKLLNNVSMYRMMSIALTTLWVIAFVFSFFGWIAYSPWAMLASIGILGTVVFLATLLFAKLFGVSAHTESSYITALILFFIFTPSLETKALAIYVLIGLIAAASKFVIAYRGRHIFNPAAIAALIISITGLGFATWWVANPVLFPFTFLLGFLIIQKTRRFLSGGIFLGLSIPLVLLVQLSYGTPVLEALVLMLSWPFLYFSSFMLTEPQTLPPKRWQQVFEVIVVAIIFAVPVHIGSFTTTPASALIIGNIIAFGFSRRRSITLRYKGSKALTPASRELTFAPEVRTRFEPGQYIEITVPHKKKDGRGIRRSFSITAAPGDDDLKLGIKFYTPSSTFKQALTDLPVGSIISATGINGSFTMPRDTITPLLFIAGGIGITPFISHLRSLKKSKETRNIVLVYSVSNLEDLAYIDVIKASGIRVIVVCKTTEKLDIENWTLVNEPYITVDILHKNIPDIQSRLAFISGPPFMIDSAKKSLKRLDVKHIKTDYFIGY